MRTCGYTRFDGYPCRREARPGWTTCTLHLDMGTATGLAQRCHYWIEKRYPGRRYVEWRRQCRALTTHPSGYCRTHRRGR